MLRSLPSKLLVLATVLTIAGAVTLPWLPWARVLGFGPVPVSFAVAVIVLGYVVSAEFAKALFYRKSAAGSPARKTGPGNRHWWSAS